MRRRKTSASRRISTKSKHFQLCTSRENQIKPISRHSTASRNLNVPCVDSEPQNGPRIVGQQRSTESVSSLDERLNEDSDWVDVSDDENEYGRCVDLQEDDYVIL